jgi:hypothetical protein
MSSFENTTLTTIPSAKERLAGLLCEIASLGSFLLQARFVGPWNGPAPTLAEDAALSMESSKVAEEIRAINLAIYHLEAAKETNKAWLRTHRPGHHLLREDNNTNGGWPAQ